MSWSWPRVHTTAVTNLYSQGLCLSRSRWRCSAALWALRSCSLPSKHRWPSWRTGCHRCWQSCRWWACRDFHRTQLWGTRTHKESELLPKWWMPQTKGQLCNRWHIYSFFKNRIYYYGRCLICILLYDSYRYFLNELQMWKLYFHIILPKVHYFKTN